MNEIVVEIANTKLLGELIDKGGERNIDLSHVPFEKFKILAPINKDAREYTLGNIARQQANELIENRKLKVTFSQRMEIEKKIKKSLEKQVQDEEYIFVEIKENIIYIKHGTKFEGTFTCNRPKFNMAEEKVGKNIKIKGRLLKQINDISSRRDVNDALFATVELICGVISFMTTNKQKIAPTIKNKTVNNSNKKSKNKNKKKKNKTYIYSYKIDNSTMKNENNISKKTTETNDEKDNEKAKRVYHKDTWYRRGHWREYKSGKKVWIKSQYVHPMKHNKETDTDINYRITKI